MTGRIFAVALVILSMSVPATTMAGDLSEFSFRPHPGERLPLAAEFVDEHGRQLLLGHFFTAKPVVLVLDYLRCRTLCGLTLQNLVAGLDALSLDAGRDFEVVVISIDPRDEPADVAAAKAKNLAAYHHTGAENGWHFLTGLQPAVQRVADSVGFPYRYEAALDQYIHPVGFVLASADGAISRYLLGLDVNPADLQTALADAARGRAVGLVTRLLLLCHADSSRLGRYGPAIEVAFIAANLAAMAGGLGAFVAIRRRRHG
jgi:protein SCO1